MRASQIAKIPSGEGLAFGKAKLDRSAAGARLGSMSAEASAARLPALLPRGQGHQFVVYGNSCSGIAGAAHEKTFASVNAVVRASSRRRSSSPSWATRSPA